MAILEKTKDTGQIDVELVDGFTYPFVSFVVITRNASQRIHKCLESIQSINYPTEKYEVIVIDGYSKDGTPEIAESMGARVAEYTVKDERSLGLIRGMYSRSRNMGIKLAKGDLVAFIDDDVVLDRDWLRELVGKKYGDLKIAGFQGWNLVPPAKTWIGQSIGILPIQHPTPGVVEPIPFVKSPFTSKLVDETNAYLVSTKACCYRKSALLEVGGFSPSLFHGEDPDLNCALLMKGYKFFFTPRAKAWHEPRQTLRSLAKQQLRAGFGQSHHLQRHPEMFELRWVLPPLGILILVVTGLLGLWERYSRICFGILLFSYFLFLFSYGIRASLKLRNMDYLIGGPLALVTWQICWTMGFAYGNIIKPFASRRESFSILKHVLKHWRGYLRSYYPKVIRSRSENAVVSESVGRSAKSTS